MKISIMCSAILFGTLAIVALTNNKPLSLLGGTRTTYRAPDRSRVVEQVDPHGLGLKNPVVMAAVAKINEQLPLVTE